MRPVACVAAVYW